MIVCDLNLPDMQGYEILMQCRERPTVAKTPIVFIINDTMGVSPIGDHVQLVLKPFTADQLLAVIAASLPPPTA